MAGGVVRRCGEKACQVTADSLRPEDTCRPQGDGSRAMAGDRRERPRDRAQVDVGQTRRRRPADGT